jgi:hypothetical protein
MLKHCIIIALFITSLFLFYTIATASDIEPIPINLFDNPGTTNDHYNSGGRRIVRINDTIIALAPNASGYDRTYRSSNNGISWTLIDSDGKYSGALISGPNEMVYHFYINGTIMYMVKFKYNATTIPVPVPICTIISQPDGAYNMLNATVDQFGTLYVISHFPAVTGEKSSIFIIQSTDTGTSWTSPLLIKRGSTTVSWVYPHFDFTHNNILTGVYNTSNGTDIDFCSSIDGGNSFVIKSLYSGTSVIANPAILTIGNSTIFVFAQSSAYKGLVYNKSTDLGTSWSGWTVIDGNSMSGYADPSPGLGNDGTIYVAYRSGARPDLIGQYGGLALRERFAMSINNGTTWSFPDDYFYTNTGIPTERTGCRSNIRYQTFWNYGGPLEWIWMQYVNNGTQHPIFYTINPDKLIFNNLNTIPIGKPGTPEVIQ